MAPSRILTNGALQDIRMSALLQQSIASRQAYLTAEATPHPSLVPLVPQGPMRRDVLYPSGKTDNAPFYMPGFEIARGPNTPAIRLQRLETDGDTTRPQGRLTIELQQLAWVESGVKCFPVEPDLSGVLSYDIPLEDDLQFDHADHDNYDGIFAAFDPERQGLTALECKVGGDMSVKAAPVFRFGLANWKPDFTFGRVRDGAATIYCTSPMRQVVLHLRAISVSVLLIEEHVVDGQNSRSSQHLFRRSGRQFERAEQVFELAPFENLGRGRFRSQTDIWSSADYVRLHQIATVSDHNTRLTLSADVRVARKHVDKTFVGPQVFEKIKREMPVIAVDRGRGEILAGLDIDFSAVARFASLLETAPGAEAVAASEPMRIVHAPVTREDGAAVFHLDPGLFGRLEGVHSTVPPVTFDRGMFDGIRHIERATDTAAEVRAVSLGFDASRFFVPVEADGTPKLSFRNEVSVQSIAPFSIDPAWFKGQIDPVGEDAAPLRLIRHDLQAAGRRATFYQDALEPQRITFEPESFQLARADAAPFEPLLLFFLEETGADEGGQPTFTVTLTFQARPVIHDDLLARARAVFGADADIRAIMPTVSKLVLMMPASAAGAMQPLEIDASEIDLSDGLIASVVLNEMQYHQVIAGFQTAGGTGLAGHIEVTLTDGTLTQVPVDLSVKDALGQPLGSEIAEIDGDRVAVVWRNRIESPVRVLAMPAVTLPTGRLGPLSPVPAQPIAAGGSQQVDYRVLSGSGPAEGVVLPELTVEPDMLAVLSQTTIVQGYDDARFTITCHADPMFFDMAPAGMAPLASLELRFRTLDETIVLTRSAPSREVELTMPKLLFLTSADAAQHYSVSVTNVHADGTRLTGPYQPGQGDLTVVPASGVL